MPPKREKTAVREPCACAMMPSIFIQVVMCADEVKECCKNPREGKVNGEKPLRLKMQNQAIAINHPQVSSI